jgi:DNA polymerase III delta prime subunit
MREQFLWTEKYRPHTIEECILPAHLKKHFREVVKQGDFQNMLFAGAKGIGKTSVALALADELGMDWIIINGSKDGNIDTLRTKIDQFATTVSLVGKRKMVVLDEADYLNPVSTQPALRNFMEACAANCGFIMTANYRNKILPELHSRNAVVEFKIPKEERPILAGNMQSRIIEILKLEGVKYDEQVLVELITKFFPDFRRTINELQRYAVASGGNIDTGILARMGEVKIAELVKNLKGKDFGKVRKWVVESLDNDAAGLYRAIYDGLYDYLKPASIPEAVLILADYQYKSAFVMDQEINLVACLTQLMVDCEYK